MKVGIIGSGIVGGSTGKALSKKHEIIYYDKFKLPQNDPSYMQRIAREAEITFTCVPTPMKSNGQMDYSAIYDSLDYLLDEINNAGRNPRELISVIRSTAVSGTTEMLSQKYPFKFAFNPEFLREKHAEEDMNNLDRVIIGANDMETALKIVEMYKEVFPNADYQIFDIKTAEMIKYAANVMLASQIAIANEIYRICRALGIEYNSVERAILHDSRIGKNIDVPGHDGKLGFGGKCLPKDLNALIYMAREHGVIPHLLEEVWRTNLEFREEKDWLEIKGATTANNFNRDRR